jgi:hypothetical protein
MRVAAHTSRGGAEWLPSGPTDVQETAVRILFCILIVEGKHKEINLYFLILSVYPGVKITRRKYNTPTHTHTSCCCGCTSEMCDPRDTHILTRTAGEREGREDQYSHSRNNYRANNIFIIIIWRVYYTNDDERSSFHFVIIIPSFN